MSTEAAGLSKLAVSFALPMSLVVGMTDIAGSLLLQQGHPVLALILAHVDIFSLLGRKGFFKATL
jgi:malonate transporter and related proteins